MSISPDINLGSNVSRIAAKELFSCMFMAMRSNKYFSVLVNAAEISSLGQGIWQVSKSDGFIDGKVEVLCSANCCIFSTKFLSVIHRYINSLHTKKFLLLITAKPVDASMFGNGSLIIPKWFWLGRTVENRTSPATTFRLALLGSFSFEGTILWIFAITPLVMLLVSR